MEAVKCTNVCFFFYFGLHYIAVNFPYIVSVNAFTSLPCAFLLYYAKMLVAGLAVGLFVHAKLTP